MQQYTVNCIVIIVIKIADRENRLFTYREIS